jgi:hypothetical protein
LLSAHESRDQSLECRPGDRVVSRLPDPDVCTIPLRVVGDPRADRASLFERRIEVVQPSADRLVFIGIA